MGNHRIESLLAARQFVVPQLVGDRLFFVSDLSGRLSLYAMNLGGSVPEPLIPPDIALPNPHHLDQGVAFRVLPSLGKILLMLDHNGDENYQPVFVPMDGGIPEPVFGTHFAGQQVMCTLCDPDLNIALFAVDPRTSPLHQSFRADLAAGTLTFLGEGLYGNVPIAARDGFRTLLMVDQYTFGDVVYYLWEEATGERRLLLGTPLERRDGQAVPPNGLGAATLTHEGGLLFISALFDDAYGLSYLHLDQPEAIQPVAIDGLVHTGAGELVNLTCNEDGNYTISYNIDGTSWVYAGRLDEPRRCFVVTRLLVGQGELRAGVLEALSFEKSSRRYALSFSTATSPSQLYVIEPDGRVLRQTNERILGISSHLLARGEEYSYTTHDGLRVSARLYRPAPELGYAGKRPVVFYIHGGPQSQERPDFTWFSMPLIQFLTLNGFAVWVPNVRGSSGYGLGYMKRIDRDWGGQDRLDHVAAFERLRQDSQLDLERAGVMGRSYGGYMTLTLAGRHPELWKAAVDMFGPYNLFTFLERMPETWKTYFHIVLGHPETDQAFLTERSPSTYLSNLACPLLVIQGANDPRVVERESHDVVERLRGEGKLVDYVVYGDEGHDVIRFVNKVDCYNRIVDFFRVQLQP